MAQEATEMVVNADKVEEANEAPATPTIENKVVAASMKAENATNFQWVPKKQSQGPYFASNSMKDSYATKIGSITDTAQ